MSDTDTAALGHAILAQDPPSRRPADADEIARSRACALNPAHLDQLESESIHILRKAMNAIIAKHEDVRRLTDNRWLHLFALGTDGKVSHAYRGNQTWDPLP
jgi:hypothetical protein